MSETMYDKYAVTHVVLFSVVGLDDIIDKQIELLLVLDAEIV